MWWEEHGEPGSETYHRLELEAVVEVRHRDHHEGAVVVLEADRQHGSKEALRKVMQHLPLAAKLCRQRVQSLSLNSIVFGAN